MSTFYPVILYLERIGNIQIKMPEYQFYNDTESDKTNKSSTIKLERDFPDSNQNPDTN